MGLTPKLLAVVARLGFTVPTPIQQAAIPLAVQGKDVIGVAQTGTGKTLAFALPLLQRIAATKRQGLIILPTRELAMQVDAVLRQVGEPFGVRRALLIGGAALPAQVKQLRQRPHVVIGTPGRIIDHLDQKNLTLEMVGVLVLDEADRMLDMGFAPQIMRILQRVPRERQTMLFSATMPPAIVTIASQHMRRPMRAEVARTGTVAAGVNQELFVIRREHKIQLLHQLLGKYTGTVLVFSRTKYGAKKLCRTMRSLGHDAAEIHSNLTLAQRRRSLEGFKSGAFRVLVATDIAARGLDVYNIALVVNFDLPDHLEEYVHRVGRTGRAGKDGQAISFVTPEQRGKVRMLERLVRTPLRVSPLPALPADNFLTVPARRARREPTRPRVNVRATIQPVRSSDRVRLHI